MGFGGGGVENLVAGTGRGAQEPGVPAWLNMHGFENQNPQPSQNPPPPSQNPPPAQSPEPSQNPPARQTPPNNDNPVPSAEPIPRTINWLTGEGTPGNRRVDMNGTLLICDELISVMMVWPGWQIQEQTKTKNSSAASPLLIQCWAFLLSKSPFDTATWT